MPSKTSEFRKIFETFSQGYDEDAKKVVWEGYSARFRDFWHNTIRSQKVKELADEEIDEIVRILDVNGKGRKRGEDAVAKVMIPQGVWRRMFNTLHSDRKLGDAVTNVLEENEPKKKAEFINTLYKLNAGKKNNMTGASGNAISALLAAYNPFANLSIVSLKDRLALLAVLDQGKAKGIESLNIGQKVVNTNQAIQDAFAQLQITGSARKLSEFAYFPGLLTQWKHNEEPGPGPVENPPVDETYLFYMEKQLEDFIIENWDKIDFCRTMELLEEDGELVSQQYPTKIGPIDILAKDKKSGAFVVIELKRNQTSDDTIGQLARYMGWIEEHKADGKSVKGIIVAARHDERLKYALKKFPEVQLYHYKMDFKIEKAG